MKKIAFALSLLISAKFGVAQETYSTWAGHQDVAINTTTDTAHGGANVVNTVTNFPTLVRLTSANANIFAAAAPNGSDIRFVATDGVTRLKHQTERYNANSQVAEFWVLVPSVAGNATTTFRIYWGKSGAADSSNGTAVFDTANGFSGVWHMNGTVNEQDATINHDTMMASTAAVSGSAAGATGPARTFDGASNYFVASSPSTASGPLNLKSAVAHTISAWVNATTLSTSTSSGNSIINKGDKEYTFQMYANKWESATYTSTYRQNTVTTPAPVTGAWIYLLGTWPGGSTGNDTARMYVNGVLSSTQSLAAANPAPDTTFNVFIGVNPSSGSVSTAPGDPVNPPTSSDPRYWAGSLDELTISHVVRDSNWVKLSYATQKVGATAVVVNPTSVPGAPTGVAGVAGNGQATVSWSAPASNGNSTITGYTVTSSPNNLSCTTTGSLTCTVLGLTNATPYTFTVTATNAVGTSAASAASATVTPTANAGSPNAPTAVSAKAANGQDTVTWTAPTGTVTGYTVTSNPDGKTCTTTTAVTCVDTGLTNGVAYTFTVVATNSFGSSPASAASSATTPQGAPLSPTIVIAKAGNAQDTISWTAPSSNGGSAITSYTATSAPGNFTCSTPTLSCVVTGLTKGSSYTFTVTATNALGNSPASAVSLPAIPVSVPGIPAAPHATLGTAGKDTITWTAPADSGGTHITGYSVRASTDSTKNCTTTGALTCVISGFGGRYFFTFTVTAINAVGKGNASPASNSVTTNVLSASKNMGIHITGNSMMLRLPEFSGTAQISVTDVWGRVVWNHTVQSGVREVSWEKNSSRGVAPGLYIVRMIVKDANQKSQLLVESKMMITP